jgi:hypothetical protein
MTISKQKQTTLVKYHKLREQITIPGVCAKELGFNLHHERRCGPAFSKPRQALRFWVSLGVQHAKRVLDAFYSLKKMKRPSKLSRLNILA